MRATPVRAQSYETFELLIGPKRRHGYPVRVIESPAGEARTLCSLNPQHEELLGYLGDIKDGYTNAAFLREFGGKLFERLFAGPIEPLYRESLGIVHGKGKSLRVRLRIDSPELATLPWEFLYDQKKGAFLAISPETALVRYVSMNEPVHATAVEPPLRVLVVISHPLDGLALNVQQEKQTIQEALKEVISQGKVELEIVEQATMANISEAMRRFSPHVFHYVGHAAFSGGQGLIMLENEHGFSQTIDETRFSSLFSASVRIAVLNACQTGSTSSSDLLAGLAPNLLKHELSAVVAMQYPIADKAALIFSREFYRTLALGYPLETAITEARKGIFVELGAHRREWGNPVLFLRVKDGQLIKQPEPKVGMPHITPPPEPQSPPSIKGFVGRKAELAYFAQALSKSGSAVISGMAGTGKTALAARLAEQLVEQPSPDYKVFWYTFHADEGLEPIIWKLAGFMAWHGQADLWQMMKGSVQNGGQLPPTTTLLDYLFQMIPEKKWRPLLCLDDFQHVEDDPLVKPLIERLRPEVLAGEVSLIITSRSKPDFVPMAYINPLMGLSLEDTHALLGQRGVELADELVKQLHTITEGNAELLTLAIASLKKARNAEKIIEKLVQAHDVEEYLFGEIHDTLTDKEREVESSVAVLLGYPGTREAIEEVYDQGRVRNILFDLTDRYLLTAGEGEWGREYGQHAMLRAFFYDLLTRRERRAMHHRAAEYYETEEPNMLKAILHYERAGDYPRAAELATTHTWQLMNQGHARPLLGLLERFKERDLEPELWAAVMITKAEVDMRLGDTDSRPKESLQTALTLLGECAPLLMTRELSARAYIALAETLKYEAPRQALEYLKQGQACVPENSEYAAKLQLRVGTVYGILGDYSSALAAAQRTIELLPSKSQLRIGCLLNLGAEYLSLGDISQAKRYLEEALTLSEQLHDDFRMIKVLSNLILVRYYAGDWQNAIADGQKAVALAERLGSMQQRAWLAFYLGFMSVNHGDDEQALEQLQRSMTLACKHKLKELQIGSQATLADLYLRRGEVESARPLLQAAEPLALESEFQHQQPEIYRHWAKLHLSQGDSNAAWLAIERSLASARLLRIKSEEGTSLRTLADVQLTMHTGLHNVLPLYEQSLACLSEDRYETARTQARWGQVLLERGHRVRGKALLQEARNTFCELGAKRDLGALEKIARQHLRAPRRHRMPTLVDKVLSGKRSNQKRKRA